MISKGDRSRSRLPMGFAPGASQTIRPGEVSRISLKTTRAAFTRGSRKDCRWVYSLPPLPTTPVSLFCPPVGGTFVRSPARNSRRLPAALRGGPVRALTLSRSALSRPPAFLHSRRNPLGFVPLYYVCRPNDVIRYT